MNNPQLAQRELSEIEKLSIWKNFDVAKSAQHARVHHSEILTIMNRIASHDEGSVCAHVVDVRNLMTDMVGRLMLHIFLDEHVVLEHRQIDQGMVAIARGSLVQLRVRVSEYMQNFASPSTIHSNPEGFLRETMQIQKLLEDTFKNEERGVYAALEK